MSLLFIGLSVFVVMPTLAIDEPSSVKLINPIGGSAEDPTGKTNLAEIVGGVISKALGIMGSLALVVFVYGGFLWLTSAGNADKVQSGGQAMLWAAIGIFIVFSSYAILKLVLQGLGVSQESDSGTVSQPGNVWCVDVKTNLCDQVKLTDCTGETFATESECIKSLK